tara:strand:+ start:199 stop:585 length:387 start_codon:yes stop_codon:yes gene_type:complete
MGGRLKWLYNADITDTVKFLAAEYVMFGADSCYSGKLTHFASVGLSNANYLKRITRKWARVAKVSGGLEPAEDNGSGGNSPFARAFLNALYDNPDISDGTSIVRCHPQTGHSRCQADTGIFRRSRLRP